MGNQSVSISILMRLIVCKDFAAFRHHGSIICVY